MKIYLDNCCYNRPYDNQSQMRVFLETQAKLYIQHLVLEKKLELVSSFVLQYENYENPDLAHRDSITQFLVNATGYVGVENAEDIRQMANDLMQQGIKMKDAAHLACAIKAGCDYFITTDDKLLKKYSGDKIKVGSPLNFLGVLEEKADA